MFHEYHPFSDSTASARVVNKRYESELNKKSQNILYQPPLIKKMK